MASNLDLQEQEQLDALKAYWNKNGNRITWLLVAVLAVFAAWNGWQYWQRDQGTKAGVLFEELDRAALAGDADKAGRIFNDMKTHHASAVYTQQGALAAAKAQADKGQAEAARNTLAWLVANGKLDELQAVARLRLAALQLDAKQYDEALKSLDAIKTIGFDGLAADRRGDVLLAQSKRDEARKAYEAAWAAMPETMPYRRLVEAKLGDLGVTPGATVATATASGAAAASAPAAEAAAPGASR